MIKDHILVEAQKHFLSGGALMNIRRCLLIHFTAGVTAQSSINWWERPENRADDLGAHLIIDRDGTVIQCRAFNRTISHAGTSRWVDPNTGKKFYSANKFAIGIELANAGSDPAVIKSAAKLHEFAGTVRAKHRNQSKFKTWEIFPEAQLKAAHSVAAQLVKQYNLDDVTGHDCLTPERRNDPGPAFPMEEFRESLGFKGLPVVHWS